MFGFYLGDITTACVCLCMCGEERELNSVIINYNVIEIQISKWNRFLSIFLFLLLSAFLLLAISVFSVGFQVKRLSSLMVNRWASVYVCVFSTRWEQLSFQLTSLTLVLKGFWAVITLTSVAAELCGNTKLEISLTERNSSVLWGAQSFSAEGLILALSVYELYDVR